MFRFCPEWPEVYKGVNPETTAEYKGAMELFREIREFLDEGAPTND
jgi:hypothetical protein